MTTSPATLTLRQMTTSPKSKSAFQREIEEDIDRVFLNLDDFAETHEIDGVEVKAVLAIDQSIPLPMGYRLGTSESKYQLIGRTYFEDAEEGECLPPRLEPDNTLNVDGTIYVIDSWDDQMDMSYIGLSSYRTR